MIRDRLALAPGWARWLLQSLVFAAYVVAFFVWVEPRFAHRLGWPWALTAIIAISAVESGVLRWAARDVRRRYRVLLDGLSTPQRLQVYRAVRTGGAPDDPEALAAAVKTCELQGAFLRGQRRSQRLAIWIAPLYCLLAAVGLYVISSPRYAAFFAVFALGFGVRAIDFARRVRRAPKILGQLRAAADRVLPELPPDAGEVAVGLTKRRYRMFVVAVTVPIVMFVALMIHVDRSRPDCDQAYAAFDAIYDSRGLTEPQSVNWHSPDLAAYEAWSNRLQQFSSRASNPAVVTHLRRIADLSVSAVGYLRSPDGDTEDAKTLYSNTIRNMVDEEYALAAYCA